MKYVSNGLDSKWYKYTITSRTSLYKNNYILKPLSKNNYRSQVKFNHNHNSDIINQRIILIKLQIHVLWTLFQV